MKRWLAYAALIAAEILAEALQRDRSLTHLPVLPVPSSITTQALPG